MLTSEERDILDKEDEYGFEALFYHSLEKWFSNDIACCGHCHNDFLNIWPYAYSADNAEFQTNSIDIDNFYSGSILSQCYTKEQFDRFIKLITCPRCGEELDGLIFPYELPFMAADDFEYEIEEISSISKTTPFLLLKHSFALQIHEVISRLADETAQSSMGDIVYRGRIASQINNLTSSNFDYAPKECVEEGRYNHAGIPVLYLASDPDTCFHELRESVCIIAEIELTKGIKVLDLTNTYESHPSHSELLDTLVYSALISSKQDNTGWHKPKYVFSRFIADCAKSAGFDAIKYPSTRISNDNYNIVLLNSTRTLSDVGKIIQVFEYIK